jgi:hypothetical protein
MNRWNHREVLDCGDEVCAVAALDLKPARSGWTEALESSYAKTVNRFALPRISKTLARAIHVHGANALGKELRTTHEQTHPCPSEEGTSRRTPATKFPSWEGRRGGFIGKRCVEISR